MFHPHFIHLFFGNPHSITDTMRLVSAYHVEQDLQRTWREEREQQLQADNGRNPERCGEKPIPFTG